MQKATFVLHSGDADKLMSALIIGNGVLAMGGQCTIYFTFWGLNRLKKGKLGKGPLSKFNLAGLGAWGMRMRMKQKKVADAERLLDDYKALGGRIIACEMTMEVMGIKKSQLRTELVDEWGAVGMYVHESQDAGLTLFI